MKLNREHPEGTGNSSTWNFQNIWKNLELPEKQRHVKYLENIYNYKNNPQFFSKNEILEIFANSDVDISIIPNEFHEEFNLSEI